MRKRVSLPALKSRLNALNEEREALSRLISFHEIQRAAKNRTAGKKRPFSQLHDSVVKFAIQPAHQMVGRADRDISAYAVQRHSSGSGENKALISYFSTGRRSGWTLEESGWAFNVRK
jgi:hypothetical protein